MDISIELICVNMQNFFIDINQIKFSNAIIEIKKILINRKQYYYFRFALLYLDIKLF